MLLFFIQYNLLGEVIHLAVHPDPDEAVFAHPEEFLPVFSLPATNHGSEDLNPALLRQGEDLVHDLRNRLGSDRFAAFVAVRLAHPGEEETEIVVDFRDRRNGGSGIPAGGFLFNGDGRRQPFDQVHVRFLHLFQELAGIGREGFHISPLSFSVDRVKGERGFA